MDFGIPTLIEHQSIRDSACHAHELGFQFVELNMNLPWASVKAMEQADLKKLSEEYQVYFTIHADENLFFCDFSDRVARAHLDNMLEAIDFAKENAIPLINFHMSPGVYFSLPGRKVFLFDQYAEEYMEKIIRFREACTAAADGKVMLCIENTGLSQDFVHQGVDALLLSPAFSLTWDVGHDYCADSCDKPFLLERKERIRHMHLHDAVGKDCHLPLGSGEMEPEWYLLAAKPERIVVEVKTKAGLDTSLPWLHRWQQENK